MKLLSRSVRILALSWLTCLSSTLQASDQSPAVLLSREKCSIVERVAVGKDRNIVAVGQCVSGSSLVRKVFKLNSAGVKLWRAPFEAPKSWSALDGLALDAEDNPILLAREPDAKISRRVTGVVLKLSSNGLPLWTQKLSPSDPALVQEENIVHDVATDATGTYLAGTRLSVTSDPVHLGNGVYSHWSLYASVSVFFIKLSAAGEVLWRQDETPIQVAAPSTSPDYSWATKGSSTTSVAWVNNPTTFPLSIVQKDGSLYSQHGALREIRDGATGILKSKSSDSYFFGFLTRGRDGKIYSAGTSNTQEYHPMYNKELITYDDQFSRIGQARVELPPSDYTGRSGAIHRDAFAMDTDGSLYFTGMQCVPPNLGCGIYAARLSLEGDPMNARASFLWQSLYGAATYHGSYGITVALDEAHAYIAAHFGDTRIAKGVLRYGK